MSINYFDLPFRNDLFSLAEAMQYSLSDYNAITKDSSIYEVQNRQNWLNKIDKILNYPTYIAIVDFKQKNQKELSENPLMLGLLNMYTSAFDAKSTDDYKNIYEEYQQVQRDNPVEKNMQNYIDMGCKLSTGFDDDGIKFMYPLFLYTAYTEHGGKDDDYRGGYLFPTHKLSAEEIEKLHETNPQLFNSESVKKAYNRMSHSKDNNAPKQSIKFTDLSFYEEVLEFAKTLQYSVSDYHKNSTTRESWFNKIDSTLSVRVYRQIKALKEESADELNQNPLLLGLLNMYTKAFEANSSDEYKDIYEEYQDIQRNHKVEQNLQNYIDMGCTLMTDEGRIKLAYPIYLYTTYTEHGGKDDDERGGYLYSMHDLTNEEIEKLHETNPELFTKKSVQNAYTKLHEAPKTPKAPEETQKSETPVEPKKKTGENFKIQDLPFYKDLFYLMEAMQYSLSDYNAITESSSDYQKQCRQGWFDKIEKLVNAEVYNQIIAFRNENAQKLANNPLMIGLLNVYTKTFEAEHSSEYKDIYEEYQEIQRQNPIEENIQHYIDMGCSLSSGYLDNDGTIKVAYPLFLYTAYTEHGGKDDDYRGGYLFPLHKLTPEQVLKLHETHPELFVNKGVKEIYDRIVAKKGGSQPGEN